MAHEYTAEIRWSRGEERFVDGRYSRAHSWVFDGGTEVPASSDPSSVRVPLSRADAVDPEEAVVAATASCHMLFFLAYVAKAGFTVDSYRDAPSGVLGKNEDGKGFLSEITLRPEVTFSGDKRPTPADLARLHHDAHVECYVANSLKSRVIIDPAPPRFV
jgi:organic hydroperoxide reductase OsmC/OhrA